MLLHLFATQTEVLSVFEWQYSNLLSVFYRTVHQFCQESDEPWKCSIFDVKLTFVVNGKPTSILILHIMYLLAERQTPRYCHATGMIYRSDCNSDNECTVCCNSRTDTR